MDRNIKHNLIGVSGKIGSGKDTVGEIIRTLTYCKIKPDTPFCKTPEIFCMKVLEGSAGIGTVGDIHSYRIKKFANKLKNIVCLLIGCTREQLEDRTFKETELGEEWWYYEHNIDKKIYSIKEFNRINALNMNLLITHYKLIKSTPRLLLQKMGTECGREILHSNIWVNSLFSDYKFSLGNPKDGIFAIGDKWRIGEDYDNLIYQKTEEHFYKEFPNWIITDVRFENEANIIKEKGGILIRLNRNSKNESQHPSETGLDNYQNWDHVVENHGSLQELIEKIKQLNII